MKPDTHASFFRFERGNHVCVFYRDEEHLLSVLTPYVAEGLRNGERCFCVQKPRVAKKLLYDLRFLGIDTDNEIKRGALKLHLAEDVYFQTGKFEPDAMMKLLEQAIDVSVRRGFTAFRSAGELSWAAKGRQECDQVVGYEKLVEAYFPERPAIGICQYPIAEFPADVLQSVLDAHQLSLREAAPGSRHSSLYVCQGEFRVEIVADTRTDSSQFDFVVQHRSKGLLGWGAERAFDAAKARASALMS
jgi:hypothetical protein